MAGRLLMAEESALDMDRIRDAGTTVRELGRRVRLYNTDMTKQIAAYIVPLEVIQLTGERAGASLGAKIQIGRLLVDGGLYLRHNPGVREIGVNDRGDVMLRLDQQTAERPDHRPGPQFLQHDAGKPHDAPGRAHRQEDARARRQGSAAWLEAMNVLTTARRCARATSAQE